MVGRPEYPLPPTLRSCWPRPSSQGISLNSRSTRPGRLVIPRANAGADWRVSNYGGTEQGVLNLIDATRVSSNTAYAQLMMEVGPDQVVSLANRHGHRRPRPPVNALVLGTEEVSPLEMAEAYSTFANGGVHIEPLVITKVEPTPTGARSSRPNRRPGALRGGHRPGHLRPPWRGRPGHRHRRPPRRAGRRQDRHHPGQPGRLVRRLPAQRHDRLGVDGLRPVDTDGDGSSTRSS